MKPILFNTAMVQAILDDRKTTTRRIVKGNINDLDLIGTGSSKCNDTFDTTLFGKLDKEKVWNSDVKERVKAPYMPGDILYVRETWGISNPLGDFARNNRTAEYVYKAGYSKGERIPIAREQEKNLGVWKPSIHMPKVVARIFLKVTSVRVERLQDITEEGIRAEGITEEFPPIARDNFQELWDSTTKEYRWRLNPYVWVISFERCEKPNE
nr:MAG TPA: ASCH domain protein [Inoviridae sp.]